MDCLFGLGIIKEKVGYYKLAHFLFLVEEFNKIGQTVWAGQSSKKIGFDTDYFWKLPTTQPLNLWADFHEPYVEMLIGILYFAHWTLI